MIKDVWVFSLLVCFFASSYAADYQSTVNNWQTYGDVGEWMEKEWSFSSSDAKRVAKKIRNEGLQIISAKSAIETFENPRGWCKDAANFAKETLNNMDSKYDAKYIFIKNKKGPPHHWVTGFHKDGEIYIMDFGAGPHWSDMMGIHGPYDSLDGYRDFMTKIDIENFELQSLNWWSRSSANGNSNGNTEKRAVMMAKKRAGIVLKKFDRNNDNKISHQEAPGPMKKGFRFLDSNEDNFLDKEELESLPPRN